MIRLLHIALALLVLTGSVGLTVNRHFCGGVLKSYAIFGAAKKCHSEQAVASCPFHDVKSDDAGEKASKKGCCDDKQDRIQLDDDKRDVVQHQDMPQLVAILPALPPRIFPELSLQLRTRKNSTLENYRPPPLVIDVPSYWQVYRI